MINAHPFKKVYKKYTILVQTTILSYRVLIVAPDGAELGYSYYSKLKPMTDTVTKVCKKVDGLIYKETLKEIKRLETEHIKEQKQIDKEQKRLKKRLAVKTQKLSEVKSVSLVEATPPLPPLSRNRRKNTKYPTNWNRQMKDRWLRYQTRCREIKREFNLTFEQFEYLFSLPCVYCNEVYKQSIDRVNSKIGYVLDNCQPCCAICNRMKWALSDQEFKVHIQKIASNVSF